ncbi:MAG: type II 3-dehydroquinate dehydratase [Proteobacteria bacterium]|nr:type II 3-dehydroquinate dehydratase [Pseudomonadota bacterium]NOG60505.1 type II 3-dehydroquinate dehydratase [Pseudomonadota bacterium]
MLKFLVLNGPNLNLLGEREPEVYGSTTLAEIDARLVDIAKERGHELASFQSNAEHELIDQIHAAKKSSVDFILFNPGAFTHTSIALRDAILGTQLPFIEVHLSNVFSREEFRKHSYLSDIAVAVISGLGAYGYELALLGAEQYFKK